MKVSALRKQKVLQSQLLLTSSCLLVFCDFSGLDANQMSDLRLRAVTQNLSIRVLPTNLLRSTVCDRIPVTARAKKVGGQLMCVSGSNWDSVLPLLKSVAAGKLRFALENLTDFIPHTDLTKMTKLPPKCQLLSQLPLVIRWPMIGLVGVLSQIETSLVAAVTIDHATDQEGRKEESMSVTKEEIVRHIENLTVLELHALTEMLRSKFCLTQPSHSPTEASPDSTALSQSEKKSFSLSLISLGSNKIAVIKVIKDITGLSLKEAKGIADSVPTQVRDGITREQAEDFRTKLKTAGAEASIK